MSNVLGKQGETLVVEFLEKKGYKILTRNFRSRRGEIDIIAEKEGVIHFVEVKSRRNSLYGHPFEFVTSMKKRKIVKTIEYYLYINQLYDRVVQIDVAAITAGNIEYLEQAFTM